MNTLTEEVAGNITGKGKLSKEIQNTHMVNELDIPVIILGVSNIVAAVSPDGILVTDKKASPRIKELIGEFDDRPMYGERRWGWYRILDHFKFENGNEVLIKRLLIKSGKNLSYQKHLKRNEIWIVLNEKGEYVLDKKKGDLQTGDVIYIPKETIHSLRGVTNLDLIEVQMGSELLEEDSDYLFLSWKEILNYLKKVRKDC